MDLMLPCFPLVGAIIGALWYAAAALLVSAGVHTMLAAAIVAIAPFLLSGFLHLDGYADTSDAMLSRRPLEEKRRILKDPHMGVFSSVMLAVLFTMQFAAVYAAMDRGIRLAALAAIPVVSRCCASIALLCLKTMPQSGYGTLFRQKAGAAHRAFVGAVAAAAVLLACMFVGLPGLAAAAFAAIGFAAAMTCAYTALQGVSGDLAGFALVIGEACGLLALGVI